MPEFAPEADVRAMSTYTGAGAACGRCCAIKFDRPRTLPRTFVVIAENHGLTSRRAAAANGYPDDQRKDRLSPSLVATSKFPGGACLKPVFASYVDGHPESESMNLETVGAAIAVIASLAGIGTFFLEMFKSSKKSKPPPNAESPSNLVTQKSSGSFSPNVANVRGNVSINIQTGKSKLDIPSLDFSLQPLPGWRRDAKLGEKFNNEMATYSDKTVYLSVTLPEEISREIDGGRDEYDRIIFTVPNDADDLGDGGSEYLIHLSKTDVNPFEKKGNTVILSGYFKVYDINGPRQGFMSVNLRLVAVD